VRPIGPPPVPQDDDRLRCGPPEGPPRDRLRERPEDRPRNGLRTAHHAKWRADNAKRSGVRVQARTNRRVWTSPLRSVRVLSMAGLIDRERELTEVYGWCGVCHSFTGFPHDCSGEDEPAEDDQP
jgi:hypothetical protein